MRFSTSNFLPVLLVAITVSGCASNGGPYEIALMPAPEVYDDGNIDPFADLDPIGLEAQPEILFATDRAPAATDDKRYAHYSNQRGHVVRLGVASIEFGYDESITWDEARRISLLKNRTEDYPLKVAAVEEFGPLARTIRPFDEDIEPSEEPGLRFVAEINRRLARSTSKDVYIYVHGYKVDFENPVLVASELWHFLGYQGAFIAFSWPTTAKKLAYFSDIENAQASARALRQLVVYISEESQAERIHIIGYSAGTRLVSRVLADIGMLAYGLDDDEVHGRARLGHVILTGSDVDRAIIGGYILDGALQVPASVTIYVSDADKALGASKFVFTRQRSGQVGEPDEVGPRARKFFEDTHKLRIIDVSDAESSKTGNGHAYFRSSPWVSSDILMTLLYDLPPAERGLVPSESLPIWTFPDDYTKRMLDALASSNPALFTGAE
jgi:hypothetical protein